MTIRKRKRIGLTDKQNERNKREKILFQKRDEAWKEYSKNYIFNNMYENTLSFFAFYKLYNSFYNLDTFRLKNKDIELRKNV